MRMTTFWSFVTVSYTNLPWLIIAAAAAFAFFKGRKNAPLILQTLGALALFAIAYLRWIVMWLLNNSSSITISAYSLIFTLFNGLFIIAILLFTTGYCWEKFAAATGKTVPAVPVG
jgi:hypothetical protein